MERGGNGWGRVMGRGGEGKGGQGRGRQPWEGTEMEKGREGKGRGEGGKREGKGMTGGAFPQIKIYDYTPAAPLVKAHTRLPILAEYPYLVAGYRNGDQCEIRICGLYWHFSVGLNQVSWIWSIIHTIQLVIPWRHASLRLITWSSREHHLTAGESTIRTI